MRYYFAGAYARRAELADYAIRITDDSRSVTSRWLIDDQEAADAGFSADYLTDTDQVERAWIYGRRDIGDLLRSDAIVSFTGQGERGGRHVEHGFALAFVGDNMPGMGMWPMRLIVVGPREHVFHCHPAIEVFPDFEAFFEHERRAAP